MRQAHDNDMADALAAVADAQRAADTGSLRQTLAGLHPAAVADILEASPRSARSDLWRQTPDSAKGDVLIEVGEDVRQQLIAEAEPRQLVAAVGQLDLDELADVMGKLPSSVVEAVLSGMDEQRRARFDVVASFPADSAGGLMDADAIAVRPDIRLRTVLRYLRRLRQTGIPELTDTLFVTTRQGRYIGRLPLATLVASDLEARVLQVMTEEDIAIPAEMSAAEVARLFEDRDWVSAPVVSADGSLVGRITIDDVVDVIRGEAAESAMKPVGLHEDEDIFAPVLSSTARRSVWLGVNLIAVLFASWVISLFESSIDRIVALAILMPVVASMSGMAGTQSLALVMRGIVLDRVRPANSGQLLGKELAIGGASGVIWAVTVAVATGLWFQDVWLAGVIAVAMFVSVLIGVLSGAVLPILLNRIGIDPALAGGVILTALTDVVGFLTFLGFATVFLL